MKDKLKKSKHRLLPKTPLLSFLMGILLSGCSLEPTCCQIIYDVPDGEMAKDKSKYYNNILLNKVTGGTVTYCQDESYLQDSQLRCALLESLRKGEYLTPGQSATYTLDVNQETLDILSEGTVQEAKVVLRVKMKNVVTDTIIFNEKFSSTFVSTPQDFKFPGPRMRLAIEEATKGCIAKIIGKLAFLDPTPRPTNMLPTK